MVVLNEVEKHWEEYLKGDGSYLKEVWYRQFYKPFYEWWDPDNVEHRTFLRHIHNTFFKQCFYEFLVENDYPLKETITEENKDEGYYYDEDSDSYDEGLGMIGDFVETYESIVNHKFSYSIFLKLVPEKYIP